MENSNMAAKMPPKGGAAAVMDGAGGLLLKGCDSPAARWSAFQGRRSPPTCGSTLPASPGSGPSGNTGLHWPLGRKPVSDKAKGLQEVHFVFNLLNKMVEIPLPGKYKLVTDVDFHR